MHRASVYQSLTLLIVACTLGLYISRTSARQMAAWAVGLGLALAAFWLTREEGAWHAVTGAHGGLLGVHAVAFGRHGSRARLLLHVVPFLILGAFC